MGAEGRTSGGEAGARSVATPRRPNGRRSIAEPRCSPPALFDVEAHWQPVPTRSDGAVLRAPSGKLPQPRGRRSERRRVALRVGVGTLRSAPNSEKGPVIGAGLGGGSRHRFDDLALFRRARTVFTRALGVADVYKSAAGGIFGRRAPCPVDAVAPSLPAAWGTGGVTNR